MITDEQARRGGPEFLKWLLKAEADFQVEIANIGRGIVSAREEGHTELHFNLPPEQGWRENKDLLALLRVNRYRVLVQDGRVAIYWGEQLNTR